MQGNNLQSNNRLGTVDIHFTTTAVHGTLILERELEEEIHLLGRRRSLSLVGIISDDSTPVGEVHLGLVFLLETDSANFAVNEPDLMTAEWASVETLQQSFERMESWSQIVFREVISRSSVHAEGEVILK